MTALAALDAGPIPALGALVNVALLTLLFTGFGEIELPV